MLLLHPLHDAVIDGEEKHAAYLVVWEQAVNEYACMCGVARVVGPLLGVPRDSCAASWLCAVFPADGFCRIQFSMSLS